MLNASRWKYIKFIVLPFSGDDPQSERERLHSIESKEGGKGLELYEVNILL